MYWFSFILFWFCFMKGECGWSGNVMVCLLFGYMLFILLLLEMVELLYIGGIDMGGDLLIMVGLGWLNESGEMEGGGIFRLVGFIMGEKVLLYGVKLLVGRLLGFGVCEVK